MPLPSYISDRLEVSRITQSPMIVYDTVGSPVGFNTTTIDLDNGYSYTFERYDQSRAPFNIGDRNYSKEEWEYLLNFFYDKRGRAIAFRYKNWGDYQASNQTLGIGDGANQTFYFTKLYGDYQKDITQLVNGTVKLRVNGVLTTSGFTIYYDVGIVVFNSAVADDAIVTADFEFDLRVRFDSDSLSSRFEALAGDRYIVNVGSILIVETLIDRSLLRFDQYACVSGTPQQVAIGTGDYETLAEVGYGESDASSFITTTTLSAFSTNTADYESYDFYQSGSDPFTAVWNGVSSGGNPDSHLRCTFDFSNFTPATVCASIWFPSDSGWTRNLSSAEIVSIKLLGDGQSDNETGPGGTTVQPVLMQDGIIYTSTETAFNASPPLWVANGDYTKGRCGQWTKLIDAEDLISSPFAAPLDSTRTSPNLSATGGTIRMGLLASVNNANPPNFPLYRGYDNLRLVYGLI